MSPLALAISYFFHLIATIIWIGGLSLLVLVVWPATRQTMDGDPRQADLLVAIRKRFTPLANVSLIVLIVTGLFQTSGDPNYGGMLVFDSDWSRAILLKHIAIIGMVIAGVILQLGTAPALERLALLRAGARADSSEEARLMRQEHRLNLINLVLGLAVLAFTAVATAL